MNQEKIWMLSFDELRVLLFGLGFTKCEGIIMPEKEFEKEDIIQALFRMQKDVCIENSGDEFLIEDDLREVLLTIGNPDRTEILRIDENGREFFVYYRNDLIAVSEKYTQKEDMLRLYGFSEENFETWKEELYDHSPRENSNLREIL